jgi:hypothetical protein
MPAAGTHILLLTEASPTSFLLLTSVHATYVNTPVVTNTHTVLPLSHTHSHSYSLTPTKKTLSFSASVCQTKAWKAGHKRKYLQS